MKARPWRLSILERRFHLVAPATTSALACCALAACGSSGSSSSTSAGGTNASSSAHGAASSAVEKVYATFSASVSKWPGPTQPVNVSPGKHLTIITCGSTGITCVRVANGAKAAAASIGDTANVVDGQQDPTVWNEAIREAITSKSDGIILAAVPPALVTGALKVAAAAHVPVAATLTTSGAGPVVRVNYDRTKVAQANTAFIAKNSGGHAHVLQLADYSDFPDLKQDGALYAQLLKQYCSTCRVDKTRNFTAADAPQHLPGDVAQALQNNPSINYILAPFDTFNQFVVQGIRQAGKIHAVKIVGVGGDPTSMPLIRQGVEVDSLGTPAEWMGWSAVDGLLRAFASKAEPSLIAEAKSNYNVPLRYVTAADAPSSGGWQGGFNYTSEYRRLWER